MTVLASCSSYRESTRRSNERQGPTLGVRFSEVSVFRESTKRGKEGHDHSVPGVWFRKVSLVSLRKSWLYIIIITAFVAFHFACLFYTGI